jgi:hypothetical protein
MAYIHDVDAHKGAKEADIEGNTTFTSDTPTWPMGIAAIPSDSPRTPTRTTR